MNARSSVAATALALALAGCRAASPPAPVAAVAPAPPAAALRGVDTAAMDRAAAPGDAFYEYANGAFLKSAEIPADRAATGAFLRVFQVVEARNRAIVEEAAGGAAPAGSEARKVGDLYASFVDEAGIEARGIEPLRPALARLAALKDAAALAAELGATVRADVDILNATQLTTSRPLGVWIDQDLNDPTRNTAFLVQGGLGMPDRSYYLDEAPRMKELRGKYLAYLEALFTLAGQGEPAARAGRALALETRLARAHGTREDAGEVQKGNNPWSRADLDKRAPGLDWARFLGAAGLDKQPAFIVWQPTALTGLAAAVKAEPLAAWKDYLAARLLDRAAPFLPRAFADAAFAFHGTALTGTPEQPARWKRGLATVDRTMGEALGRLYVERHFPAEAKAEIQSMVEEVRAAFARRIDALDWMTPATRARAKEKVGVLIVGVGYPDRWKDWSALEVRRDDLLGNLERAGQLRLREELGKLGRAPDRGEWCMSPHTVNAVNLPARNALNFPAGFLEPPFYDRRATAAVKFASIGAVIGHEISHSFDDQGALFDAKGRLANWWTPEDLAHFQAAGAKLVAQYDAYRPFSDAKVNGRQTLGENLADLAGLAAAHDAWRASLGAAPAPVVDGLSGEQQFFVAFAQTWQNKMREKALRQRLLTDGHAPGPYRALTVRNLDAWYQAFDVKPGQALYLAPAERVRVW